MVWVLISQDIVSGGFPREYSFEVDPILRMIRGVIWPSPTNRASITGMVVTQVPLNTNSLSFFDPPCIRPSDGGMKGKANKMEGQYHHLRHRRHVWHSFARALI